MINIDDYTNDNKTGHNPKWPYIPDHPYRILMIGGSGSGKTNALLNLINKQPDIDKIYLYAKDPYETKYQFLINRRQSTGLKHFNPKAFIEYSNNMHDVYKNIDEYNSSNINEVIRAVLNSFFFFLQKIFCTHRKHQKHQKNQKHKNATKQKHKTQISEQK